MKKAVKLMAVLLALVILAAGCTRNYSKWSPVYCDSIGLDSTEDFSGVSNNTRTAFYVPDEWICSRVGDYIFFASYEIDSLEDILQPGEELYMLGWIADSAEKANYYDATRLFDNVTIPQDSAMFSTRLSNGAVFGRERYDIGDESQPKYYITLRSNTFYEIKLIDWQDVCGKELMKEIAESYAIGEVPKQEKSG